MPDRDFGGGMAHEWIFDVLNDLRTYAEKNNLPRLAAQVAATLVVAKSETTAVRNQPEPNPDNDADAG
jgi:hypothetical protein